MLLSSLEIQERIDALVIEAEVLNKQTEDGERDQTPDEKARWSAIMAKETGELAKAKADLVRAKEREDQQAALATEIKAIRETTTTTIRVSTDESNAALKPEKFAPQVVHYGQLSSFKGENAREDAYRSGVYIAALCLGNGKAQRICGDMGIDIRAAMTEGSNIAGGYLVLPEFEQAIIDLRIEYGVFGRFAKRRPMGSDVMSFPRRNSGLTAYAVGENIEITESQKVWSQVEVTAKKWGVLSLYSSELDEDAFISMADDLAGEMASALVEKEDRAGFNGDGTSTFHGITGVTVRIDDGTHTASVQDAAASNDSFETLDYKDFADTVASLPAFPGLKPVWHISRAGFYASMDRLAEAAGGNTRSALEDGPRLQFLGFPVIINEVTNSTLGTDASAIKCLFGDLGAAATFGMRRGLRVDVTKDRYFELDQIGIKGTTRWGISVHDLGDNTDAGPIVALKTSS